MGETRRKGGKWEKVATVRESGVSVRELYFDMKHPEKPLDLKERPALD
ncbi:MAG: hypothetical protein HPY84_04695 [Syntrophobacteraceae bacterium]|nr:hypothetical protein [Syntrophobacteraceae bacterium]